MNRFLHRLGVKEMYLGKSGFMRFKFCEINWSIYSWALPFSLEFSEYAVFVRFLCVSLIFKI